MRQIFSILILTFLSLPGITFERTYGKPDITDLGYSVQPTTDGGYIIGGTTEPTVYFRSYLIKTDSLGDTIWSTISNIYNGITVSVLQLEDQGYLSLDKNLYCGYFNFQFARFDSSGRHLWHKTYGGDKDDEPHGLVPTLDGNYLAVGATELFGGAGFDLWLVKVDTGGNLLWSRTYGDSLDEIGYDLDRVGDGFVVVGMTESFGVGFADFYLLRIDASGDTLWTRTYGGLDDDIGMAVRATPDGGFILAGATSSYGAGSYDVYLIKTDSLGDTIWTRTYGGPGWEGAFDLCISADSGYVIVGETYSFGFGLSDVYLLKVNRDGDLLWQKTHGYADDDRGYCIQSTPDRGFIIAGITRGEHGSDWDIYFLKTDAQGNIAITEKDIRKPKSIRIYPNPSYGLIHIVVNDRLADIRLFDATGRQIKEVKSTRRLRLKLSSGIYFLQIKTQSQIKTEKIIILK